MTLTCFDNYSLLIIKDLKIGLRYHHWRSLLSANLRYYGLKSLVFWNVRLRFSNFGDFHVQPGLHLKSRKILRELWIGIPNTICVALLRTGNHTVWIGPYMFAYIPILYAFLRLKILQTANLVFRLFGSTSGLLLHLLQQTFLYMNESYASYCDHHCRWKMIIPFAGICFQWFGPLRLTFFMGDFGLWKHLWITILAIQYKKFTICTPRDWGTIF